MAIDIFCPKKKLNFTDVPILIFFFPAAEKVRSSGGFKTRIAGIQC